jgi:RNase H-fold protein (predicted Holliday junction resolvase)
MVVWVGTWHVGRNETEKGLHQIKNFARKHNDTNVIVMSVPHRYDLESTLCVNNEVKMYNRKLRKHLTFKTLIHLS